MEDGEFVATFSADGRYLLTGWASGFVKIFSPVDMSLIRQMKVPNSSFVDVEGSPDNQMVAATSGTVRDFRQRHFHSRSAIEFHAFARLEALPCVRPMAFLSGVHSADRLTL
jgi:WD40 repeat protein